MGGLENRLVKPCNRKKLRFLPTLVVGIKPNGKSQISR